MATGFSVTELTLILEDMTLSRYYTSDRDELSSSFFLLYVSQKFFGCIEVFLALATFTLFIFSLRYNL